ncbi:hypothetical protein BST36_17905 [Mycolicibacterium moriokaense]|uniref:Uncharacterized protein n=1 Tax=Mycolicibacterium moriokaense TaxID=39691 RepID=A0AAD1M912_9MYCO|nr:hypothetical protein [Mycolicibacterium moriokaense]ORB20932.1 hypothetical protein BST36_17905 [Mycolicibacterium moriokaense]BBX04141.1 hypothetical protein MMOR_50770 [Mycolicibacterium moriokaense]
MSVLRRVLNRRVSVEAMIEFAMWLAVPYLLIGLVWAFFDAEQVQLFDTALRARVPAGSEILAFVLAAVMWPQLLLGANFCVA